MGNGTNVGGRMSKLKNRRGVTLVLMAFMLTVLIGAAAIAVDFSRMMLYRAELSSASDAAALAGIYQVLHKGVLPDSVYSQAKHYAGLHRVGPDMVTLADADIVGGSWDLATRTFTPLDWTDLNLDAVRVVSHYDGPYTFGRVFGFNSHTVRDTAIAVMGYVGISTCIRPVALPYQMLLNQLYDTNTDGTPKVLATEHDLTDQDVANLRAAGRQDSVQLKLGNDATQGNFYLLQMGPYAHADKVPISPGPNWGGNNIFADRFGGNCANSPWLVGPGDWMQGKTGDANGPTEVGFEELCGQSITGNGFYGCTAGDSIKIAMWANEDDGVCTPRCFEVKYIGVFVVTGYTKSPGTNPDGVWGYFTSMPSSGALTNIPTPIQKIGLVY